MVLSPYNWPLQRFNFGGLTVIYFSGDLSASVWIMDQGKWDWGILWVLPHIILICEKINTPWKENSTKAFSSKHTMCISSSRPFPMLLPLPHDSYHFLLSALVIATQNKDEECITQLASFMGTHQRKLSGNPKAIVKVALKVFINDFRKWAHRRHWGLWGTGGPAEIPE